MFNSIGNNLGVRTSKAGFSKIAYDQKHEMNNKTIYSRSGYIDLVNMKDTSYLRKIEICYAEVNKLLEDKDDTIGTSKHEEEALVIFNKTFLSHCNQFFAKMTINPFTAERFQMLNGTMSFPPEVIRDCTRLFSVGRKQYQDFILTRIIFGSKEVIQTGMKKNNLMIMRKWKEAASRSSSKIKISLGELTKLRSACEVRSEAARQLFCQVFTNMPECLVVKEGGSYHNDKSLPLKVIAPESTQVPRLTLAKADGLVVDMSVVKRSGAAVIKTSEYT